MQQWLTAIRLSAITHAAISHNKYKIIDPRFYTCARIVASLIRSAKEIYVHLLTHAHANLLLSCSFLFPSSASKYPRPGAARPTSICAPESGPGVVVNSSSGGGANTSALSSSNNIGGVGQSAIEVDLEAAGPRIETSSSASKPQQQQHHQHNHSIGSNSNICSNNNPVNNNNQSSNVQTGAATTSASAASSSPSSTAATTPSEGSTSRSASAPQIR